ncbi:hypothetical protein HY945_04785 [Candidatus Gottesmanbacteria bacterium]|nr:hypothetical protein [Candidatus Gottesmanbacteria bacterium]
MKSWQDRFSKKSIFYITPDVKRGIGLEGILPNYHIITTYGDPLIPVLRNQGANIFCLSEKISFDIQSFNNSGRLLENPLVAEYIRKNTLDTPYIIVFKPSLKIDLICQRLGYRSLVNSRELNDKFEDKINFWQLTKRYFPKYSIPGGIGILGKLNFADLKSQLELPLVIQFSHGWAGKTTFFVRDEKQFQILAGKYPLVKVKVTKYIDGFTVLNNACIYGDKVLISPPAIQINNIAKLKEKPMVTCGRQWPVRFTSEKQNGIIGEITSKVGLMMGRAGFKGFFGLDILVGKHGDIYLSEDNARFTASSSFYTKLELGMDKTPLFIYHLAAFLGEDIGADYKFDRELFGSQMILRNQQVQPKLPPEVNFGVFQPAGGKYNLVQKDCYSPQNLKDDQFIFMRRTQKGRSGEDLELARIECRWEILETPTRLVNWLENLIV